MPHGGVNDQVKCRLLPVQTVEAMVCIQYFCQVQVDLDELETPSPIWKLLNVDASFVVVLLI